MSIKNSPPTSPVIIKAERIIVNVFDVDKMVKFYSDVLGLVVMVDDRKNGWVVFSAGSIEIALHDMPALRQAEWMPKIVFSVLSIKDAWNYFKENNIVIGEMADITGSMAFDITDPEGNDYQFIEKRF